jgi:uncharacterized protein (TIGR02265 family)
MSTVVQPTMLAQVVRPVIPDAEKQINFPLDERLDAARWRLSPAALAEIQSEFRAYLGKGHYPALTANALADRLCVLALPDQPRALALQQLGREYILHRYPQTILGRVLFAALPLLSLAQVMRRLPRNYAATTNFGTYTLWQVGERHWRFEFADDPGYPDWILGTLQAGSILTRTPNVRVTCTLLGHYHFVYDIQE